MSEELDFSRSSSILHGFQFIRVSYVRHVPGHKDSSGSAAPWVIVSHESGKILASFPSESEANEHLKRMHFFKTKGSSL